MLRRPPARCYVFDAADGTPSDDAASAALMRLERSSDNGAVQHAAFSPDSRMLLVGSGHHVWSCRTVGTGDRRNGSARSLTGYGGTSRLCVFPDGKACRQCRREEAVTVVGFDHEKGNPPDGCRNPSPAVRELSSSEAAVGYPAARLLALAGNARETDRQSIEDTLAVDKRTRALIEDLGSKTFRRSLKKPPRICSHKVECGSGLILAADFENAEVQPRPHALDKINRNGGQHASLHSRSACTGRNR